MHELRLRIGPVGFRIGSAWAGPLRQLDTLYAGYPRNVPVPDYTVRLESAVRWRRWLRPPVAIAGDYSVPEAVPLPYAHALLAAEMAMNLQLALGEKRFLLLHASSVERDGRVLLMTGESGSGKSTLAAQLGQHGWRFMGDEFALIDPETGLAWPFPRAVSLKNESIAAMLALLPEARFGPLLAQTPKGDIRHLRPDDAAIAAMTTPGKPALLLFPRFGQAQAVRDVPMSEAFVRLTQASTNYVALGERGFTALTGLVRAIPARAMDFPDGAAGVALAEQLWAQL